MTVPSSRPGDPAGLRLPTLLLLLTLLWAALYLPGLGGPELKGEEGRRVLPGLTMLETGEWVLPHLNGEPYLRKPPLINWVVAGAVRLTGETSEWSVRLPSVLSVLALTLVLAWSGSRWMGTRGGALAGLFVLVNASLLEKGRLAEIEALYIALSGIAIGWWVAGWMRRESGWRLWLVPQIALALGILAKGPVPHVFFFYGVVLLLLHADGEKRRLLSVAHFASLALGIGLVLLWWIPYQKATADLGANDVMARELIRRVLGRFEPVNLLRAFANGLPWILFGALWWSPRVLETLRSRNERLALLVRTLRWPVPVVFIGLMLIGGMLPRYTLPLYPLLVLLLAPVVPESPLWSRALWHQVNRLLGVLIVLGLPLFCLVLRFVSRPPEIGAATWAGLSLAALLSLGTEWWSKRRPSREAVPLALRTTLHTAAAMAFFHLGAIPFINQRDTLRPVGAIVEANVPRGEPVYVIDPGYEASLFYVRRRCVYLDSVKKIPPGASYVLARTREYQRLRDRHHGGIVAISLREKGEKEFFLLKLVAESETTPSPKSDQNGNSAKISNSND